jgi:chitodextrinase
VALVWVAAGAAIAPPARAVLVRLAHGRILGVQLTATSRASGLRAMSALAPDLSANLTYNGGPVLHTVSPYLVVWNPAQATQIPDSSRALLERYLSDVADAPSGGTIDTLDAIRQYYDAKGYADAGLAFDPAQQLILDGSNYPAADPLACSSQDITPAYPYCVGDHQIQAELASLISSRRLPTGLGAGGSTAPGAPVYLVVTPPDVNVCYQAGSCAASTFCGYHSSFSNGPSDIVYAVVPFLPVFTNPKKCQQDGLAAAQEPNGDLADTIIDDLSHELNEAITDPLGDAWYVSTPYGLNEVADSCEMAGPLDPLGPFPTNPDAYLPTLGGEQASGTLYDQLISGDRYYTQTVWSNGDGACVPGPTPDALTATFIATSPPSATRSPPQLVGSPLRLDPSASGSTDGFASATWSFGDGTSAFTLGAPAVVTHSYANPGSYQVTLTLVDVHGNIATAVRSFAVYRRLVAAFTVSPRNVRAEARTVFDARRSRDPNNGATITAFRWSFGKGATASGRRVTHTFKRSGSYTVTLTLIDSGGVTSSINRAIHVRPRIHVKAGQI